MTGWLVVKNWAKHQHYKDRTPPWIKLHYTTLDDYAWCQLPDVSKAHLTGIWLLSSREDGRIPNDAAWVAKKIGARSKVDLGVLIRAGFLGHDDSGALAACKQNAPLDREETEEETETETDYAARFKEFDLAWRAYPAKPGNPKARAWKAWQARIKEGVAPETLFDGVTRYAAFCRRERTEAKYVKMASTFFGPDRHWETNYRPVDGPRRPNAHVPDYHRKYVPPKREEVDPKVAALLSGIGGGPKVA